jgi:lipoprotein-releasing system permease protein
MEAPLPDWPRLRDYLLAQPGVEAAALSSASTACWSTACPQGGPGACGAAGAEANLSDAGNFMTGRGLRELQAGEHGVILGKIIADKLGSR